MSLARTVAPEALDAYWNQQYFLGVTPPHVLGSEAAVSRFVAATPGAIGYRSACPDDSAVVASFVIDATIGRWSSSCSDPEPHRPCGARPPITSTGVPPGVPRRISYDNSAIAVIERVVPGAPMIMSRVPSSSMSPSFTTRPAASLADSPMSLRSASVICCS